jgi:calcineurin-like phosphoesterase family protein
VTARDGAATKVDGTDFKAPILELPDTRTTRAGDDLASLAAAGWSTSDRIEVPSSGYESLRWSNIRTLVSARNEKIAKRMRRDPAAAMRNAWIRDGLDHPDLATPLKVELGGDERPRRVVVVGDTGDRSEAQAAVATQLLARTQTPGAGLHSPTVDAVLIQSDIVYPAGSASEYEDKFYGVYGELFATEIPVYAVPGNHDWNDGSLTGFVAAFCSEPQKQDEAPKPAPKRPDSVDAARRNAAGSGVLMWLLARQPFWHNSSRRGFRPSARLAPAKPRQRGPYVAIDVDGVLFVGIDTGYGDTVDSHQARWLINLVEDHPEKPKILFSGKPLIVNGRLAPCPFSDGEENLGLAGSDAFVYRTVDDVVRRQQSGFVAVLGGDVHNYQRYLAHIRSHADTRQLPYVVCGGGGVFVSQTAWLPRIDIDEEVPWSAETLSCKEEETVLFPQRAHSRIYLTSIMRQALWRVRFTLPIALGVFGLLCLLWWFVGLIPGVPAPHGLLGPAALLGALAINIGSRPIRFKARLTSLALSAAAAAAAYFAATQALAYDSRSLAVAVALLLGQALLMAAESVWLSKALWRRWVGRTLSALLAAIIVLATAAAAYDALPTSLPAQIAALVIGVLSFIAPGLPQLSALPVSVADAFGDEQLVLAGRPPDRRRRSRAFTNWLASNQRLFSVFETFTDGRVDLRRRIGGVRDTLPLIGSAERLYMPLYRCLLEIEFQRKTDAGWEFVFVAHAVTGERVDAGHPVIVDAFRVRWQAGRLEFEPQLPAAS